MTSPPIAGAVLPTALLLLLACAGCSGVGSDATTFDDMVAPPPTLLSASDSTALMEQNLDMKWEGVLSIFPAAVRPEVQLERMISLSEQKVIYTDCMNSQGFSITFAPDGSYSTPSLEGALGESYLTQLFVCQSSYPVNPINSVLLTAERLTYLYAYYRDRLTPCIEAEGYEPRSLPSEQVFLDAGIQGAAPSPLEGIDVSPDRWYALLEACPEFPDGFYQ